MAALDGGIEFIAATETLSDRGWFPRIFQYTGAVMIRRTWRQGEKDVQRPVDPGDLERIGAALKRGWLVTFPQGTTTPGAPVRKGTAHIIRQHAPVVVPVVLRGFEKAFHKKGFRRIGRGVELSVRFAAPLSVGPEDSVEKIVEAISQAIGVTSHAEAPGVS